MVTEKLDNYKIDESFGFISAMRKSYSEFIQKRLSNSMQNGDKVRIEKEFVPLWLDYASEDRREIESNDVYKGGSFEDIEEPFSQNLVSLEKSLENFQKGIGIGEFSSYASYQLDNNLKSLGEKIDYLGKNPSAKSLYEVEKAFYDNLRQKLSPALISGKYSKQNNFNSS